ncbi:MAG: hypothetical protein P8X74_20885 [Reinekea sp.]
MACALRRHEITDSGYRLASRIFRIKIPVDFNFYSASLIATLSREYCFFLTISLPNSQNLQSAVSV